MTTPFDDENDDLDTPYQTEPDWDEGDFNDVIDDPNRQPEFPETD